MTALGLCTLLLALLVGSPGHTLAAGPPEGFRQLRWGDTLTKAKQLYPRANLERIQPDDRYWQFRDERLMFEDRVAGMSATIFFDFFSERFGAFEMYAVYPALDNLRELVESQYGARLRPSRNEPGELEFSWPGGALVLGRRLSTSGGFSYLKVQSAGHLSESSRRIEGVKRRDGGL